MSSVNLRKNINVVIYSYKGKALKEVIDNLIDKSSGFNNLSFQVFDQFPLTRSEYFLNIPNFQYIHIFWDHIKSPCKYKSSSIKNSNHDYVLILSDNVLLTKNWDEELIKFVGNRHVVVSGTGIPEIHHDGIYYLKKEYLSSQSISQTDFINRDFIFAQVVTLKLIEYPDYLKYNGEEETLSIMLFTNDIPIYSFPSNFYETIGERFIESTYHTFSKDHNYNEFISLLKNGNNKYIHLKKSISEWLSRYNISSDYIKPLPFPNNDVEYDPQVSPFDKIDSRKFMTKVNYIS